MFINIDFFFKKYMIHPDIYSLTIAMCKGFIILSQYGFPYFKNKL